MGAHVVKTVNDSNKCRPEDLSPPANEEVITDQNIAELV